MYIDLLNIDPIYDIIHGIYHEDLPEPMIQPSEYESVYIKVENECLNPYKSIKSNYNECNNFRVYVTHMYAVYYCFPNDFTDKSISLYKDNKCINELDESDRNIDYNRSEMNPDSPKTFVKCESTLQNCVYYQSILAITKYFQLYFYESNSNVWTQLAQHNIYGFNDSIFARAYSDLITCTNYQMAESLIINSNRKYYGKLSNTFFVDYEYQNSIYPLNELYLPTDTKSALLDYLKSDNISLVTKIYTYIVLLLIPYYDSAIYYLNDLAESLLIIFNLYWLIPTILILIMAYNNKYISINNYSNINYLECMISWCIYLARNIKEYYNNPSLYKGLLIQYDIFKFIVILILIIYILFLMVEILGLNYITSIYMYEYFAILYAIIWIINLSYNWYNQKSTFIRGSMMKLQILENSIEIKDYNLEKLRTMKELYYNMVSSYTKEYKIKLHDMMIQKFDEIRMYSILNVCYKIDTSAIAKSYLESLLKSEWTNLNKKLLDKSIISYHYSKYENEEYNSIKDNLYNSSIENYSEIKLDHKGLEVYKDIQSTECNWNDLLNHLFSYLEITTLKMMSPKASYISAINDELENSLIVDEFLNPIISNSMKITFEAIIKKHKFPLYFTKCPIKQYNRSLEKLQEYFYQEQNKYQNHLDKNKLSWYDEVENQIRNNGFIDLDQESILSELQTPIILNLKDKTRGSIVFNNEESIFDKTTQIKSIHDILVNLDKHFISDDKNLKIKYWYHKNMYNVDTNAIDLKEKYNCYTGIYNYLKHNTTWFDVLMLIMAWNTWYYINGYYSPKASQYYVYIRFLYLMYYYLSKKEEKVKETFVNEYKDIKYYYIFEYKDKSTVFELQFIDSKMIEYKKQVHKYYSKIRNKEYKNMEFSV